MKEQKFRVLATGNFYFPYLYKNERFIVKDTLDLPIKGKDANLIDFVLKRKSSFYFGMLAEPIWELLKKEIKNNKEYKNCWFVPLNLMKLGKEYIVSIDVLKKVR